MFKPISKFNKEFKNKYNTEFNVNYKNCLFALKNQNNG